MNLSSGLLVLAGIFSAVTAGPLNHRETQCATTCTDEGNKFGYETGRTYIYSYEATAKTTVPGATRRDSELYIRTRVKIDVLSKCNLVLRLLDVTLENASPTDNWRRTASPNAQQFIDALQANPLPFAFQDGRVEHICASEDDPAWVLNIKRGILSVIQNSMEDFNNDRIVQETDITGTCDADYKVSERGWSSMTVKKTKDLLACKHRHAHHSSLQSLPYESSSPTQSLPILGSTHECTHTIKSKRIESARCEEKHVFRPFSKGNAGVTTTIVQVLTYESEETARYRPSGSHSVRTSLLFDHKYKDPSTTDDKTEAENTLSHLCQVAQDDIRPEVPVLFSKLVRKMRELNQNQLQDIFDNLDTICNGDTKSRKFFLDALQMTLTADAMELVKELIIQKEISDMEADIWLLSTAFVPHPTKSMIKSLTKLIELPSPRQKAVLGLSAMVHTYCQQHECETDPDLQLVLRKYLEKLDSKCSVRDEEEKSQTLVILKALGNMGFGKAAVPYLERCYKEKENSVEVRIGAVEALRRMPCGTKYSDMLHIFADGQEDTEVRIAAYLLLMKCPTKENIYTIKDLMHKEEMNQVYSFVWTHLTNIQESVDPCKQDVRELLRDEVLKRKFSTDSRKFSRAFEGSLYSKEMNVGMHTEGSLIFSQKSFLPRSASLNLTADLFGNSINLFEIGGRVEGFEHLVESFFGPNGYYPEKSVSKILRNIRGKRSVDHNKLTGMEEKFRARSQFGGDRPKGSMFLRIFGNDLHYAVFDGWENHQGTGFFDLFEKVLKQEEVDITKSFTFLDSSFITPTAMGLPLNLTLNGTAVVNLQMKGHLDLDKIAKMDCDVTGYLKPSAAVQVTGTMAMDAFVLQTGLQLKATLHTSTAMSGKVQLKRGELVNVQIDAPREKMEIININTEVLLLTGAKDISQAEILENTVDIKHCSGQLTTRPLGFEVCAQLKYPNSPSDDEAAHFPLTGPAGASIYMKKTDPTLSQYVFEYRWQNEKKGYADKYVHTRRLSFDTPGSTMDRDFTAELIISEPEHSIRAALRTPFKKVGVTGKYTNDADLKKVDGSFSIDDQDMGVVQAALQVERNQGLVRLVPSLYVRAAHMPLVALKGYATIQKGKKIGADLTLEHLTVKPITFQGEIGRTQQAGFSRYEINTKLKSFLLAGSVKGHVLLGDKQETSAVSVEYSVEGRPKKQYDFSTKYRNNSSQNGIKHSANVEIQGTDIEALFIDWDLHTTDNKLESIWELTRGRGDKMKKITLHQSLSRENEGRMKKVMAAMRASCPACGVDWGLDASHQHNGSALSSRITVENGKGRKLSIEFDAYNTLNVLLNIGTTLNVYYPGQDMKFSANLNKPSMDEIQGYINAEAPGKKLSAKVNHRHDRNHPVNPGHEVNAEVNLPDMHPIIWKSDIRTGKHPSASAEYEYDQNHYAVAADYEHTSGSDHKLKGLLALPKIRYDAEASLSNQPHESRLVADLHIDKKQQIHFEAKCDHQKDKLSGSVDFRWDSHKYANKRVFVSFDIKKPDLGYEIAIAFRCPRHSTRFEFLTKTEGKPSSPSFTHTTKGEFQWDQSKVAASLDINQVRRGSRTELFLDAGINIPLIGLDQPSVSYSHTVQDNEFNFEAKLQHRNDVYKLTSNNRIKLFPSFESVATLIWPNKEPIEVKANFQKSDRKCIAKLQFKDYELLVSGEDNSGRDNYHYLGTVLMKSDDTYSFSCEYKKTERKISTVVTIKDNQKTWTASIEGVSNSDDSKTDVVTAVHVTSQPTKDSEATNTKITARYINDGSNLSSMLEIILDQTDRFAMEIVGSKQMRHQKFSASGSIHVVSTFGPVKDLLLIGNHEYGDGKASSNVEVKWDDDKAINLKIDVTKPSIENFKLLTVLTTPIDILERLSVDINHSLTDKLETTLKAVHNDNSTSLEIKGLLQNTANKYASSGTAILRTSNEQLPELQVSFNHTRIKGEFSNRLQLSWGQSSAAIIHSGMYKDWLNFHNNIIVKTPYKGYEVVAADARQLYSTRGFTHQSSFDMGSDKKYQITVDSIGKGQSNGFKQQLDINVLTPKKTYGPFRVEIVWKSENGERVASGAVEMPSGQKVEVSGTTSFGNKFGKWMMKMMTPFDGLDNVMLSGMYDARDVPKKVSLSLQWDPEQRIELESNLKLTGREGGVQLTVTTPFEQFKTISIGGHYNVGMPHQVHNIFASVGDSRYEAELTSSIDDDFRVTTGLTLRTPIRGWEKMRAEYSIGLSKGYVHAAVEKNEKQIKGVAILHLTNGHGEIGLQLYTPLDGYQVMKSLFSFDFKHASELQSNIEVLLQKENITVNLKCSASVKPEKGRVYAKLTSSNFNLDGGFEGTWHTEGSKSSLKAVAYYNADRVVIQGSVITPDGNVMATMKITTPFDGFAKLEGTVKLDRTQDESVITAQVEQNTNKYEVVAAWALFSTNSHASLSVKMPLIPDVFASAQYDISTPAKTAAIVASYGEEAVKLSANVAREYTRLEGFAELKLTSKSGNRDYSLSFNEDFGSSPQYTSLNLKANENFLKIMCTDSRKQNKGKINVIVDGSMFEHENNGFEITYDFNHQPNINIVGTFGNRKFKASAKNEGGVRSIEVSTDFPLLEDYSTVGITAVYKSQESENNLLITVKTDDEVTELSGNLLFRTGKQELKLASKSPHKFFEALDLVTGFSIDGPEKNILFTARNKEDKIDLRGIMRYDNSKSIASLFVTTTNPNYESVILQGIFDVSQPTKTIKFTMENGNDKTEAMIAASSAKHKGELKVTIASPYAGYEDISFLAQYDHSNDKAATVVYHWAQEKEIKLTLKLVKTSVTGDIRVTVTTPFRNYENTDVTVRFNFRGSEKNAEFNLMRSNTKSVEFSLNMQNERDSGQLRLNVITPFKQYAHYELVADYDVSKPDITANVVFAWTNKMWKDVRFSYSSNRGVRESIHVKFDPITRSSNLVEFKMSYDFSSVEKKVKVMGTVFGETTKFTGNINTDQWTLQAAFQSPYTGYELISIVGEIPFTTRGRTGKLNGKWNDQTMNVNFFCEDKYCLTDNDVQFSLNSHVSGWEKASANLKYKFAPLESNELLLEAKRNENWIKFVHYSQLQVNSADVQFKFTSSIPEVPILSAKFEMEYAFKSMAKAIFQYGEDKTIELSTEFTFRPDYGKITLKMTTPFPKYETSELNIEFATDGPRITGSVVGIMASERIELTSYIHPESEHGSMKINLNTPFTEPLSINGNYDLSKKEKNTFLTLQYGREKIDIRGTLNIGRTTSTAKLSISTPFLKLETFNIDFELDYGLPSKHVNIILKFPDNADIQLKGDFMSHGVRYISGNFTLKTPINGLEKLDVKSMFKNDDNELGGLLALRWSPESHVEVAGFLQPNKIFFTFDSPEETVMLTGAAIRRTNMLHWDFNLERGGESLVRFIADVKHNFPKNFDGSLKLSTAWREFPEFSIVGKYQTDDGFRSQLDIISPFELLRSVHAECIYQHKGFKNDEASLTFELPDNRLHISLWHKSEPKTVTVGFKTESTFSHIPNTEFKFKIKFTDLAMFYVPTFINISLDLPNSKHSASYSLEILRNEMNGQLNIDCPRISDRKLSSHFSGTFDENQAQFTGSLDVPSGTYTAAGDIQYDEDIIKGNLKTNGDIKASFECNIHKKEIKATIVENGKTHHVSGSYQFNDDIQADINFDTPLMNVKSSSLRFSRRSDSLSGMISLSTNADIHSLKTSAKWGKTVTAWHAVVETPLLRERRVSVDGKVTSDASKRQAELTIKTPRITHSVNSYINTEGNVVTAQIAIESPLFSNDTWTATARVSNVRMKNISVELSLITTTAAHTLSFVVLNKESRIQWQIKLKTPLFNINSIALIGTYSKEHEKTDFSIAVKLPQSRHSLSSHIYHSSTGFSAELNVETPAFNINTLTMSVKMPKEFDRDFEATVSVTMSEKTHTFEMNVLRYKDVIEANINIRTPAFNIGFIGFNGKIVQQGWLNTEIMATFETRRSKHSFNLSLQKYSSSMVGQLKLDLPILDIEGFQINLKIVPSEEKGRFMEMIVTTEKHQHKAQVGLQRMAENLSSSLVLDSPLLEPIKINVNTQGRCSKSCTFNAEIMSGQETIKIQGNYRNQENGVEMSFNIDTPFKNFENVKGTAQCKHDRSSGFDAKAEIRTSNPKFDIFSIQAAFTPKRNEAEFTVAAETPFEAIKTVKMESYVNFRIVRDITDVSARLMVTIPKGKYTFHGHANKSWNRFSLDGGLDLNTRKAELAIAATYEPNNWEGHIRVGTPFSETVTVDLKAGTGRGRDSRKWQGEVKHGSDRYAVNFDHSPEKGKLDVASPFYGHESTSVAYSRTRNNEVGKEYVLEIAHGRNTRGSLAVQINPSDVKIQVVTPLRGFENLSMYFGSKENELKAEVSLNNDSLLKIEYRFVEGQHIIEVSTPEHPMMASFSRSKTNRGWVAKGQLTYDMNHKALSTYGLEVEKIKLDGGYNMIVIAKQGGKKMMLSAQTQKLPSTYYHKTEFMWDVSNAQGLSYEIEIRDGSNHNKRQHDVAASFQYLDQAIEFKVHHEKTQNDLLSSADIKWGTQSRMDKHVGTKLEHHNLSSGRQQRQKAQFTLSHHKLEKDIVLRSEVASFTGQELFMFKTDLEYSHNRNELLQFEFKVKEDARNRYNAEVVLKHPMSNLDLYLDTQLAISPDTIASRANFKYLDRFGKHHDTEVQAKVSQHENEVELQIQIPDLSLTMKGSVESTENQSVLTLQGKVNNELPVVAKIQIDRTLPTVLMEVLYNPRNQRYFTMSAGMPTQKLIKLEASHDQDDGQKIQDLSFVLQLNNSRVLDARASWQMPSLFEAINIIADKYSTSKQNWYSTSRQVSSFVEDEIEDKVTRICSSMATQLRPLLRELSGLLNVLERGVKIVEDYGKKAYRENQFFSKDIVDGLKRICCELNFDISRYLDYTNNAFHQAMISVKRMPGMYAAMLTHALDSIDDDIQEWRATVHQWTQDSSEVVRALHRNVANAIIDILCHVHDKVRPFVSHLSPSVKRYIERVCDRVENLVDATADYMADLMVRGRHAPGVKYVVDIINDLAPDDAAMETLKKYYDAAIEKYTDAVENGAEFINRWATSPQAEYVSDMTKEAYDKASWAYDYWAVEDNVKSAASRLYSHTRDFLLDLLHDLTVDYPHVSIDASHVTEFHPDEGHFRHTQQLPVDWHNFGELPNFSQSSELRTIVDWKDKAIDQLQKFSLWDTYNKHKPKFSLKNILPPFSSYAMLAGKQHYMTFDKRFFEFSGKCSYLLAHDFVDRNFTAVVNYEGEEGSMVKKSLFLMFRDNKIEVDTDFTVTVNKKKMELPIQIEDITVTREDDTLLVHSTNGVQVTCNFGIDVCVVEMAGWYFGKTGGLFGTYDNEPKNDFVTPERKQVNDVAEFAGSWEIGDKNCQANTNLATRSNEEAKICADFFKSSESPLRSCFYKVKPDDYLTMCNNDVSGYSSISDRTRTEELACTSVAAYVTRCNLEGVANKMPDSCVKCNLPTKGIFKAGEEITLKEEAIPRSADVVFVVEEKLCNKNIKLLQELVKGVEAGLQTQNIKHNRYALIGFGGDGVHDSPHIHTAGGQVFSNERSIVNLAFSTLETGNGNMNLLAAIRMAALLSYRAAVSKSVLVLPCSDSMHYSTAEYDIVHHMLKKQNIKLHVFAPSEFEMERGNRARSKEIIGIDSNSAYTLKDRDMEGDTNLRSQVIVPMTLPVSLALHSNGSVFSRPPIGTKPRLIKSAQEIFVRRVALTTNPAACQKCHCVQDKFGQGQAVCAPCDSHGRKPYSPENQELYKQLRDYTERAIQRGIKKTRSGN